MKIIGHGVDMVDVTRMRDVFTRQGKHFEERIFSEVERTYCNKKQDPLPHFAARFAAKEAYGKALGLGLGPSGDFTDIEVHHDDKGAPLLHLKARAKELFLENGGTSIFLSLSHDGDMAIASILLVGD